jgi:hypothetical protein
VWPATVPKWNKIKLFVIWNADFASGSRMKPRIRIKANSQFVQATPHETAPIAKSTPGLAIGAAPITKEQFDDLNRRST